MGFQRMYNVKYSGVKDNKLIFNNLYKDQITMWEVFPRDAAPVLHGLNSGGNDSGVIKAFEELKDRVFKLFVYRPSDGYYPKKVIVNNQEKYELFDGLTDKNTGLYYDILRDVPRFYNGKTVHKWYKHVVIGVSLPVDVDKYVR